MRDYSKYRAKQLEGMKSKRRKWLAENGPCKKCSSVESLEVDHVDPATKIDHKVWSWSEQRRAAELKKCQVLCRKCHEEKTAEEFRKKDRPHGTNTTYKSGCRCAECRAAAARHMNEWRWATGRRKKRKTNGLDGLRKVSQI